MNNYIKTIMSGLKQWVSTQITKSKSDWNQSDSSATNYVKNRTHYSEVGEIQVLPIKTLNNTSFSLKTPLVAGKKYTIAFNDVAYQCVAKDYNGYIMIGNNAVYEYDDGVETDTGEPFAIESNGIEAWIYLDDSVTSAPTVSIVFTGEIVHKLDKKYLPDSVVVSGDLADVATSGSYYDLSDAPDVSTVVKYSSQSLTTTQKAQARSNIGASDFSGDYNDLTNTPCNTITNRNILFGSSASSSSWASGSGSNTKKYTFSNVNLLPGVKYEIVLRQQTTDVYTEQFTAKRVTYTSPAATMVAFGNASLYYDSTENTGEPVCAVYSENNFTITVYVDVDALGSTPTYIGVYRIEETVNQLDDKYIPSTIARAESVNTLVGDVPVAEQIENAIADIEKPVQSDWNESDQTSQAHILNRVCYEDYEYNEMVSGNLGTTLANGYYFKGQVVESNPITLGETYRVIYNGNEYMLESHECINDSNATIVYLGNAIILEKTSSNYTDMQDTGEPFVFTYSDITKTLSISAEDSGVPFTVEKQLSVLKQLDEKFIPDTIARASEVNELNALVGDVAVSEQISEALINNQGDWIQNDSTKADYIKNRPFYTEDPVEESVFASTSLDFDGDDAYFNDFSTSLEVELLQAIVPGVEYVVTFDGTEYRRTAFIDGFRVVIGNAAFIAGEDTGEPFAIDTHGGTYADICVDHDNMSVHTISIVAIKANVHKIDMKYIPDCLIPKKTYVELVESEWIDDGSLLCQVVEIGAVTANSKIDLQPTAYQVLDMQNNDIAFMIENDNGVVTAYCLGGKPNKSYTMQVLITEVVPV